MWFSDELWLAFIGIARGVALGSGVVAVISVVVRGSRVRRYRSAALGMLVSIVGSILISVCSLSVVIFGLAWGQDFGHSVSMREALVGAPIYAIGITLVWAYYAAIPVALIGALVGFFRRR